MAATRTVSCNACGAPLDVGENARFVTCSYCDARLRIEHSDSAVWTEAIEKLERGQKRIAREQKKLSRELRRARLEQELSDLNQDWERERATLMIRQGEGKLVEPGRTLAWLLPGTAAFAVFALVALRIESIETILAVLFMICGSGGALHLWVRSMHHKYERALAQHVERTSRVEARLRKLERSR